MTRLGGRIVVLFALVSPAAWQPAFAEAQYFWAAFSPDGESVLAGRLKGFDVFEAKSGTFRSVTERRHPGGQATSIVPLPLIILEDAVDPVVFSHSHE